MRTLFIKEKIMKMLRKGFVFLCFLMIALSIKEVKAATFNKGSTKIYYGTNYTYYNKMLDSSIAYCIQFGLHVPPTGVNYSIQTGTNSYQKEAYIAGQIIAIGSSKYSGQQQYLYISEALNCYFKESGYYASACGNSEISSMVSTATSYVDKYKYSNGSSSSSLPKININYKSVLSNDSANSTSSNMVYNSGNVVISGLNNTKYGSVGTANTSSTVPTYTVSISSSASGSTAQLCNSSGCISNGGKITSNGTYYIKVTNAGTSGGKVTLKINGTNTSKYPSAKRWVYSSYYQKLVTKSSDVSIKRSVVATATFNYSVVDKYSASIMKVDDSGNVLQGASLKLFTAADEKGTIDTVTLCETSANDEKASCSKQGMMANDENKYTTGRYICYSESTTPNGYISIETKCEQINLSSDTRYYKINVSNSSDTTISESDYKAATSYNVGTDLMYKYSIDTGVRYSTSKTLYKYVYSDGRDVEYKTTNEEYRHVDEDGNGSWYIENTLMEASVDEDTSANFAPSRIDITVTALDGTLVCYNESSGENANVDYCSGDYRYDSITFTGGNVAFNVGNTLNYVNISKRTITGTDELPGAKLSIYTTENKTCSNKLATSKRFVYSEYVGSETTDSTVGTSSDSSSSSESSGSTSSDVVSVDTEEGNESGSDIASSGLTWTSSDTAAIIYGLNPGTYCLVEETPAKGYIKNTTVIKFSMDENGKVTTDSSDNYDKDSNTLFLTNKMNKITISKTDVATSEELPGATLSICEAGENNGKYETLVSEIGDCTVTSLASGELATWVSTNEPHEIKGLKAGTYYLVETSAPNGYTTAESIMFTMKEDGTLVDANGNSLADNKLVMHDKSIEDAKTGQFKIIAVVCILIVSLLGTFYYICYKGGNGKIKKGYSKLKGRKLHY